MKAKMILGAGVGAMLLGFVLWMYGGAQAGFYKTYYTIDKIDEITELEYTEQVDAFLPGIETLVLGFGLFVVLSTASVILDRRSAKA